METNVSTTHDCLAICKIAFEFPNPCEVCAIDVAAKKCYLGNFQDAEDREEFTISPGFSHVYIESGMRVRSSIGFSHSTQ